MYRHQVEEINKDLLRTRKAIIGLGCSFTQGQGAINDEIYEDYGIKKNFFTRHTQPGAYLPQPSDKTELLSTYPNLRLGPHGKIDYTWMEYDNAFVNVLCQKYLDGKYTPINFGLRGCGNRGTVKELYLNSINFEHTEEIIVIFGLSGLERFDFINDTCDDHFRFKCMWPFPEKHQHRRDRLLWTAYRDSLYSDKFAVLEQICHIAEAQQWCTNNNAKLVLLDSFDSRYNKDFFLESLKTKVNRGTRYAIREEEDAWEHDEWLIDKVSWDNFFYPNGFATWTHMLSDLEPAGKTNNFYFDWAETGSPNGYITPCSHPSQKSHDLLAKLLKEHIFD